MHNDMVFIAIWQIFVNNSLWHKMNNEINTVILLRQRNYTHKFRLILLAIFLITVSANHGVV